MFEKMVFSNVDEKAEFEKYIKIKGQFLFKQIYCYLIKFDQSKVKYSDLSSCIKYDKNLRDALYIYLATFEEYLRAQLFDRYDIERDFKLNRKEEDYIIKMAQNVYKQAEKEDSELYKKFNLDLGETIELVKEIKMFDVEKCREFNEIRKVRNVVMHHNLVVLGKEQKFNKIEANKEKMKAGIKALANNLPEGYKLNFINKINNLSCDFADYKLKLEI